MKQVEDIVDVQDFTQYIVEAEHVVFHNDHVEHDMNDGTDEERKRCATSRMRVVNRSIS